MTNPMISNILPGEECTVEIDNKTISGSCYAVAFTADGKVYYDVDVAPGQTLRRIDSALVSRSSSDRRHDLAI